MASTRATQTNRRESLGRRHQCTQRRDRVGVLGLLIRAPPQDARKSHRDARLVPRRRLNSLEAELEHVLVFHVAYGAKLLERVLSNPRIELANFLVGEARVRLREWHERLTVP